MQEANSYELQDDFENHTSYKLMRYFNRLIVVLDSILWYHEGVLLVSSDRSQVSGLGSGSGLPYSELLEFHENDLGRVIRVTLGDAVKLIAPMNEEEHSEMIHRSVGSIANRERDEDT